MTLDDVRAAAAKATAWRPSVGCDIEYIGTGEYTMAYSCGKPGCAACLGAKRAVEDIAASIDNALVYIEKKYPINGDWRVYAFDEAENAATVASYFASEPNPVSEFRDAVRKFLEAGK